jgi:hypothetical protein
MPKLIDHNPGGQPAIGNDGLLRFIDEINDIRARSGNRFRFEPSMDRETGILKMREHLAIPRHADPGTPSPLYSGHARIAAE